MSTFIHQLSTPRGFRVGHFQGYPPGPPIDDLPPTLHNSSVEDDYGLVHFEQEEESYEASEPLAEEEFDDVDLYYFSADSDASVDILPDEVMTTDTEDDEDVMPGGWPCSPENRASSPPPCLSRGRPQSFIADGVRITVTEAEDDYGQDYDYEDRPCLRGSDSAASFFTAAESLEEDLYLLSPSPTTCFLQVPVTIMAPSPSVLTILEEFASSPPLPALVFEDDGEADLWPLSASPTSTGLLTPPGNDCLATCIAQSPEFASNVASFLAPPPTLPSSYPWSDSILAQYLDDEEIVDAAVAEQACSEPVPYGIASTRRRWAVHCSTSYQTLLDIFDSPIASPCDGGLPGEILTYKAIVTSDSQECPREPFEELWECARASVFTERVTEPQPVARVDGQAAQTVIGKELEQIDMSASATELSALLDLYAPTEPTSVPLPASRPRDALLSDEDEEFYRAPSTIRLTGAGPHPDRRLGEAARRAFWEMWTRPSGADLAALFKRGDDPPSGLNIFVEEDEFVRPLLGNGDYHCTFQQSPPVGQPDGLRERLKQEHRDAFLALWKESLEQEYLQ